MKTISVREFLRGGYRTLHEPVIVMSHSKPIGIWDPATTPVSLNMTTMNATTSTFYGGMWGTPTSTVSRGYDEEA